MTESQANRKKIMSENNFRCDSAAGNKKRIMRIYLAARYSRRLELCEYRKQLLDLGYEVQARWLDGEHQLGPDGTPIGDKGESLVESGLRSGESISEHDKSRRAEILRAKFADDDYQDVSGADIVISFTEQPRLSSTNRGGRHVEFGIALAHQARVITVGFRENIFHWLPQVEFFETWDEALQALTNGDKIVQPNGGKEVEAFCVLHSATPGNDYCNGSIAPVQNPTAGACMCTCIHIDDPAAILAEKGLDKRPAGK